MRHVLPVILNKMLFYQQYFKQNRTLATNISFIKWNIIYSNKYNYIRASNTKIISMG